MNRTYRVIVRGRFENLTDAQRKRLRDEQDEHDMFAAKFTQDGTFLYPPELSGYQFRYQLEIDEESPADADVAAELEAQQRAEAAIRERDLQGRIVKTSVTCLDEVKIRKGILRPGS